MIAIIDKMRRIKPLKIAARYKLTFLGLLVIGIFCYFHLHKRDDNAKLKFFKENIKFLDGMNATECKLPKYNLYDPQIKQYINKPPTPIQCGTLQPYLTYMDWDGYLYINKTELELNKYTDLKCFYEKVVGDKEDDYKVRYENQKEIEMYPTFIEEPVIRIKCDDGGKNIYTMIHSQIRPPDQKLVNINKEIPSHRPSVLIFTIDSMSRGNFIRALPLTYKYLMENHQMKVFKGLNKVADNTFPNMMALLAGFFGYIRNDMPHVPKWTIKLNSTVKRYDDMPIIWKSFKEAGYVTMYCEEYLDATFSLLDVGFREDPVDYYYRSTYVSLKDTLANMNHNKIKFWDRSKWRYCIGNEPSYKYMLNYTEEFLTEMAKMRYFALSFFVEMSHEYLNDVKNMDQDLFNFFKKMYETGMFDNTVLLVMGDHGHRFDGIRSTFIGRIEERMPFLGIILPETIRKSHPHLDMALESHTERLLSWYDIHETLVDLALDDLDEIAEKIRPKAVGKSIFRQFDENRTCTQIGILPEYCMCDRESQIPTSSPKAFSSAMIVVDEINKILRDAPRYIKMGETRKCAALRLHRIVSGSASMRSFSTGSPSLLVRVVFEVQPSGGLFEAAVEYAPLTDPHVLGDINRINKYGKQPSCINHDILRLYCYCV